MTRHLRPEFQNSNAALASSSGLSEFEIRAGRLDVLPHRRRSPAEGWRASQPAAPAGAEGADRQRSRHREPTSRVGELPGGYFVEDDGPGIDGTPEDIARLFSIARPMVSTKLLRLPTRGALGNGLRVVAGAVLASEGSLVVITAQPAHRAAARTRRQHHGRHAPRRSSTRSAPASRSASARRSRRTSTRWTGRRLRSRCRPGRSTPAGRRRSGTTSAQFHELLSASGKRPVRDLVAALDGCTGGKAGEIVAKARLGRALCADVTQDQATKLLLAARASVRAVSSARLGSVGPEQFPNHAYAKATGITQCGSTEPCAEIPFVVEAWVRQSPTTKLTVCVNRTPVTGVDPSGPRQARYRLLRLRAVPHRRRGSEGSRFRDLAQHHDAVHADHVGRQGTEP